MTANRKNTQRKGTAKPAKLDAREEQMRARGPRVFVYRTRDVDHEDMAPMEWGAVLADNLTQAGELVAAHVNELFQEEMEIIILGQKSLQAPGHYENSGDELVIECDGEGSYRVLAQLVGAR